MNNRTKTNFEAYKEVLNYWMEHPEIENGFINEEQCQFIEVAYEIKERSVIELRDARDFTVCFSSNRNKTNEDTEKYLKLNDCTSAVTSVIDRELFNRGEEV